MQSNGIISPPTVARSIIVIVGAEADRDGFASLLGPSLAECDVFSRLESVLFMADASGAPMPRGYVVVTAWLDWVAARAKVASKKAVRVFV